MTSFSIRAQVAALAIVVLMVAVECASWRNGYDYEPIEVPAYEWRRATRGRPVKCAKVNNRCDNTNPCCEPTVCMTTPSVDPDGLRIATCVIWSESQALYPRLGNGKTCTDSWQCAGHCCREYRAHRHEVILECGTYYDGVEYHTCVSNNV